VPIALLLTAAGCAQLSPPSAAPPPAAPPSALPPPAVAQSSVSPPAIPPSTVAPSANSPSAAAPSANRSADAPLPPPLPAYDPGAEQDLEPQVTIIRRETETVEEVRVAGELRYIKVTPRFGFPYYLVPSGNGRTFLRSDSLDFGTKAPMWLLFSW